MNKKYCCEICSHKFPSNWKLQRHMKVHNKTVDDYNVFVILQRLLSIRKKIKHLESMKKNILNETLIKDLQKENEIYTKLWNEKKLLFT
jgi:guanylate kinase